MVLRILAWIGLLLGGFVSAESTFLPPHHPNFIWILLFVLSLAFFLKNGFLKSRA